MAARKWKPALQKGKGRESETLRHVSVGVSDLAAGLIDSLTPRSETMLALGGSPFGQGRSTLLRCRIGYS